MNDQLLCRVIFTITNFRNLGAFYHVTSRGNGRKALFKSRRDREQFLSYLENCFFLLTLFKNLDQNRLRLIRGVIFFGGSLIRHSILKLFSTCTSLMQSLQLTEFSYLRPDELTI
jgi:hypothetical protein